MTEELEEVINLHEELSEMDHLEMTDFEMMQIAVQVQKNKMFKEAYLLRMTAPGALEAIAMQLGMDRDCSSIKHSLNYIGDSLLSVSEQLEQKS